MCCLRALIIYGLYQSAVFDMSDEHCRLWREAMSHPSRGGGQEEPGKGGKWVIEGRDEYKEHNPSQNPSPDASLQSQSCTFVPKKLDESSWDSITTSGRSDRSRKREAGCTPQYMQPTTASRAKKKESMNSPRATGLIMSTIHPPLRLIKYLGVQMHGRAHASSIICTCALPACLSHTS
jgi:hypothetical protein